ncbi:MAG: nitrogenase iron-molybdenum cofactor biosynthesis protein NifN [Magnetococcales bacterium]|nr:nitrogenase iron-molybdenum cofactor biosynthesis protein NifN [Magnetococcales bacterium]
MAELIKRKKALSVRPLKSGQPTGAALAFQGIRNAIPMLHGSQGCTAFTKVFFVRHFRDPIPLQTTAMDQVSTVMGGDDNVITGLKTIAEGGQAQVIGLITTGLTEVQGSDIHRLVRTFKERYPELSKKVTIVPVNAADFKGSMESGFAKAVYRLIDVALKEYTTEVVEWAKSPFINVLPGSHLTPGDLDALKRYIRAFDLDPLLLPDISRSLDGHLAPGRGSPVSVDGAVMGEYALLPLARGTLSVGEVMDISAQFLHERTNVPGFRRPGLMGLAATDWLVSTLKELTGLEVPEWIERDRARLQDAMMDTHFSLSNTRVALAGEPDWLLQWQPFLAEMGIKTPVVVSSTGSKGLLESDYDQVKIGDLEDMEEMILALPEQKRPQLLIGNSHVAEIAGRLNIPVMRGGYPLYDWVGGQSRIWIGYEGARQTLFEMANTIFHAGAHQLAPYRSRFAAA